MKIPSNHCHTLSCMSIHWCEKVVPVRLHSSAIPVILATGHLDLLGIFNDSSLLFETFPGGLRRSLQTVVRCLLPGLSISGNSHGLSRNWSFYVRQLRTRSRDMKRWRCWVAAEQFCSGPFARRHKHDFIAYNIPMRAMYTQFTPMHIHSLRVFSFFGTCNAQTLHTYNLKQIHISSYSVHLQQGSNRERESVLTLPTRIFCLEQIFCLLVASFQLHFWLFAWWFACSTHSHDLLLKIAHDSCFQPKKSEVLYPIIQQLTSRICF